MGSLPIGAAVSSADGWSVRFDSLSSEAEQFRVAVVVSPAKALALGGRSMMPVMGGGHADPLRTEPVAIDWLAEDDVGNSYLGTARFGWGPATMVNGELLFGSPLDPEASKLTVLGTGTHERAVVTIDLAGLGRQ